MIYYLLLYLDYFQITFNIILFKSYLLATVVGLLICCWGWVGIVGGCLRELGIISFLLCIIRRIIMNTSMMIFTSDYFLHLSDSSNLVAYCFSSLSLSLSTSPYFYSSHAGH